MNAVYSNKNIVIKTERLILRPFEPEDLNDFFEYAKVEGVGEKAGWPHHENIEQSKKILDMFIYEQKVFAIVLKSNNKVIGSIGVEKYANEDQLSEFDGYNGREIGYVLSKDYWGQGLVPEAVKAVNKYLFDVLNYDFLICGYDITNSQSKRVQEKCGFVPYRRVTREAVADGKREEILNILINPKKDIKFNFSHPETLIYKENN